MPPYLPLSPTLWLFALAVMALWVPAPPVRGNRSWAWCAGLTLACAAGVLENCLDWRAVLAIAVCIAVAYCAHRSAQRALRIPLLVLTGAMAFLFALHRIPGFTNPVLAHDLRTSPDAPPFALRANFDTAVAGIILMGIFVDRICTGSGWRAMLGRVWPVLLSTLIVVLGLGMAAGYVRPDLKWAPDSALFLVLNLLFTCVTEEAFFRGFLLAHFERGLARWHWGATVAVVLSALLFGLAHARGGAALVALATVAGLHYGAAYVRTRRVEGAILTHFALNAVHFVAFTYPALAG